MRRRRRAGTPASMSGCAVVLVLLCVGVVLSCLGGAFHTITSRDAGAASTSPTATPHWATIWSYAGHGSAVTGTFTVPTHWRLLWSCDPASAHGQPYDLWVDLLRHAPGTDLDGMPYGLTVVKTTCQTGTTSGATDDFDGEDATIYAEVHTWTDTGAFKLEAQVLSP